MELERQLPTHHMLDVPNVQKAVKRGIIQPEADHAWFVERAADDTSLIEHLAKRRSASI